jgi:probable HAF family extracellular repeat protein
MQRQLTLALAAAVLTACRDGARPIAPVADIVATAADSAGPAYQWTSLDTRPGQLRSFAVDVNNHNQVIGYASSIESPPCPPYPCVSPPTHAVVWEDGLMRDLGTLGGTSSEASEINESGRVVGWSYTADSSRHAFFWDREQGVMQDLGPLELGSEPARGYHYVRINERGEVVGNRPGGGAFLWERGVAQELPLDFATAINNRGQVVGWVMRPDSGGILKRQAALWEAGTLTELGTLGGNESRAVAISNSGWVVGTSWTDPRLWRGHLVSQLHPFRWRDGRIEDLGLEWGCCETIGSGYFVNNPGQVVAQYPAQQLAALWDHGVWRGFSTAWAFDMNSQGAITGKRGGQPFVWKDGVMRLLGTGEGTFAWGFAINEGGVVAGYTLMEGRTVASIWVPVQDAVPTAGQVAP